MRRLLTLLLVLLPVAGLNVWMFGEAVQGALPVREPAPAADARGIPRCVVLVFDGVDFRVARDYMAAGHLPELSALAEEGAFHPLRSENPPESPVALASMLTGVGPDRHRIFDFVLRGAGNRAENGMMDIVRARFLAGRVPVRAPAVQSRLAAPTFTQRVWQAGYPVLSLREAMLFPVPDRPGARMTSGLGTPDLSGSAGFYAIYSRRLGFEGGYTTFGGLRVPLRDSSDGRRHETWLWGPQDPTLERGPGGARRRARVPLVLTQATEEGVEGVRIRLQGEEQFVPAQGRSGVFSVSFELGTLPIATSVAGTVRFEVRSADPLEVLADPVQIDPRDPLLPVSTPGGLGAELWNRDGPFETMGWQEQTFALNDTFQSDEGFLRDMLEDMDRGRVTLLREMRRVRPDRGVSPRLVFYTFTATDRACHCYWRYRDPGHPAHDPASPFGRNDPILRVFQNMDAIVGAVRKELGPEDVLWICSDHGFTTWRWQVHVNQWLVDHGYLVLKGEVEHKDLGGFFTGAAPAEAVDWTRTRAFALGLGQIYVNLRGRDDTGIVAPEDKRALMEEIRDKLMLLENPYRNAADERDGIPVRPVRRVTILEDVWDFGAEGAPAHVPDLQIGFDTGYRISWQTALLGGMAARGDTFEQNEVAWSGDHCSTDPAVVPGILFCNRPVPPAPQDRPYHVRDVAATVMEHFGLDLGPLEGQSRPIPHAQRRGP